MYMYKCMCACMHMLVQVCVCAYVCVCVCAHMLVQMCVCARTCTHMQTYVCVIVHMECMSMYGCMCMLDGIFAFATGQYKYDKYELLCIAVCFQPSVLHFAVCKVALQALPQIYV